MKRASVLCRALLVAACGLVASAVAASNEMEVPRSSAETPNVRASADGRSLVVTPSEGAATVHVSVLNRCGDPAVGEPRIRNVSVEHGIVTVIYGKYCAAELSLETMVLKCTGCD
jgi:hypothetical protein